MAAQPVRVSQHRTQFFLNPRLSDYLTHQSSSGGERMDERHRFDKYFLSNSYLSEVLMQKLMVQKHWLCAQPRERKSRDDLFFEYV